MPRMTVAPGPIVKDMNLIEDVSSGGLKTFRALDNQKTCIWWSGRDAGITALDPNAQLNLQIEVWLQPTVPDFSPSDCARYPSILPTMPRESIAP